MNWLRITKGATSLVVQAGVGAVVANIVKSTTPKDIKPVAKFLVGIGGFVISSMVASAAVNYVNTEIDQVVKDVEKARYDREEAEILSGTGKRVPMGVIKNSDGDYVAVDQETFNDFAKAKSIHLREGANG